MPVAAVAEGRAGSAPVPLHTELTSSPDHSESNVSQPTARVLPGHAAPNPVDAAPRPYAVLDSAVKAIQAWHNAMYDHRIKAGTGGREVTAAALQACMAAAEIIAAAVDAWEEASREARRLEHKIELYESAEARLYNGRRDVQRIKQLPRGLLPFSATRHAWRAGQDELPSIRAGVKKAKKDLDDLAPAAEAARARWRAADLDRIEQLAKHLADRSIVHKIKSDVEKLQKWLQPPLGQIARTTTYSAEGVAGSQ